MYTIKEMKFPILITLDESGIDPKAGQMYKMEIQDANLVVSKVESSNVNYLVDEFRSIMRRILGNREKLKRAQEILEHSTVFHEIHEEGVINAITIVEELIKTAIQESESPIRNTFNLYIHPLIGFYITDWLSLWGQESDWSYNIAGNKFYIVHRYEDTNRIEKIE